MIHCTVTDCKEEGMKIMTAINKRDLDKLYHIIGFLLHIEKDMIPSRDLRRLTIYLESLLREVAKLYRKLESNPPLPPHEESRIRAKPNGMRVTFGYAQAHLGNPELEAARKAFQRNNK